MTTVSTIPTLADLRARKQAREQGEGAGAVPTLAELRARKAARVSTPAPQQNPGGPSIYTDQGEQPAVTQFKPGGTVDMSGLQMTPQLLRNTNPGSVVERQVFDAGRGFNRAVPSTVRDFSGAAEAMGFAPARDLRENLLDPAMNAMPQTQELTGGLVQSLPGVAASFAAGPLAPAVAMAQSGGQTFNAATERMQGQGATYEQAAQIGRAEAGPVALFTGVTSLPVFAALNQRGVPIEAAKRWIARSIPEPIRRLASKLGVPGGEALQEGSEQGMQMAMQAWAEADPTAFNNWQEQVLQAAAGGAIVGSGAAAVMRGAGNTQTAPGLPQRQPMPEGNPPGVVPSQPGPVRQSVAGGLDRSGQTLETQPPPRSAPVPAPASLPSQSAETPLPQASVEPSRPAARPATSPEGTESVVRSSVPPEIGSSRLNIPEGVGRDRPTASDQTQLQSGDEAGSIPPARRPAVQSEQTPVVDRPETDPRAASPETRPVPEATPTEVGRSSDPNTPGTLNDGRSRNSSPNPTPESGRVKEPDAANSDGVDALWSMTKAEFRALNESQGVRKDNMASDTAYRKAVRRMNETHRGLVEMALSEGKTVPDRVLADYPELQSGRVGPPPGDVAEPKPQDAPLTPPKGPANDPQTPPNGRPDLANPAREQSARDFVDKVDEKRNQDGEPKVRTDKEVLSEANTRLKKDYHGERKRLVAQADKGAIPSDTDVMIARRIVEDSAMKAITGGDSESYYEALTLANAYRNQGADIARSFRQRREDAKIPRRRPLPEPKKGESRAEAVLRSFEERARQRMQERRQHAQSLRSGMKPGQRIGAETLVADLVDAVSIGVSKAVRAGIRGGRSSIQAIRELARNTAEEIGYEGDQDELAEKIRGVLDRSTGADGEVNPEKLDRALAALEDPEMDAAAMNRDAIANILTTPPPKVRQRLSKIQDRIREAQDSGDTETIKKIAAAKEKTLRRAADTVKDVQAKMKALGVDPETITNADLSDPDTAARVARAVSTAQSTGFDMVHEYWINSILSGPLTHIRNITGNTVFGAWELGIGKLAQAGLGKLPGFNHPDAPTFTEWAETWKAFMPSLAEATRSFAGAFRTEMPVFTDSVRGYSNADGSMGVKGEVLAGRASIPGKLGRAIRIPTRTLLATDEFYKTIYTKMVLHGEAYRLARKEGLSGTKARARAAELVQNPTPELWEAGLAEAERLTFQTETEISRSVGRVRNALPGLRYIVPFVKTPLNVFGAGLKMSPLGIFGTAAKLARKGLVSMNWAPDTGWTYTRRDVGRDVATNLLSIGAAGMLYGLLDDDEPLITGSASREYGKRAAQFRTAPPYSVRIGDNWYSYRGIEPFATALATTVDGLNAYRKADTPAKGMAALGSAVSGLVKQSGDKTFLKGIGDLFAAIENQSGTGKEAAGMVSDMAVGFVPNLLRQSIRAADPTERDSSIKVGDGETFPGAAAENALRKSFASWTLPPRLDIWGRTVENRPTGNVATDVLYRMLSPVQKLPAGDTLAVDRMLTNWNNAVESKADGVTQPWWPTAPDNIVVVDGKKYRLDQDEYVRLVKESGSATLKMLGKLSDDRVADPKQHDIDMVKKFLTSTRKDAARRIVGDRKKRTKD